MSVQYRVEAGRSDVRTEGPDDAPVVVSVPLKVAGDPAFDATVEYMRGGLKATGPTAEILALLKSGAATATLRSLATPAA